MTVYPDLVFVVSVLVNAAVFRLSLKTLDLKRSPVTVSAVVFVSGVCSAVSVLPGVPSVLSAPVLLIGAIVCFRGKNLRGTLRNLLGYLLVWFLYGACFLGLLSLLFRIPVIRTEEGLFLAPLFPETAFAGGLSFAVGLWTVRLRKKRRKNNFCCDCVISWNQRRIPLRCYVDTGNFLRDPGSGLPVAVVEWRVLRRQFGPSFPEPMSYEFAQRFGTRYRVVPFHSVSSEGQMLPAFLPDGFEVCGVPRRAVIAVSERTLEQNGRFSGMIGPDLWEENA